MRYLTLFSKDWSKPVRLVMDKRGDTWFCGSAPSPMSFLKGAHMGYIIRFAMNSSYIEQVVLEQQVT